MEKTVEESRSTRRQLLKRSGLIGAAWSVPVLLSFDSPAFANRNNTACTSTSYLQAGGACGSCGNLVPGCEGNGACFCFVNDKGCCFCANGSVLCSGLPLCTKTKQCPLGWQCIASCCDPSFNTRVCAPPCGAAVAAAPRGARTLSSRG
jgi:hypothetical protein